MIIFRYLIKEVFNALFAVSFVMLLIFLSNQLIRYLKYAAKGKIAAHAVVQLIGLEIPYLLVILLPLGLYLGIIFAYGRLYAENELRVMQACGLSMKKIVGITMAISLAVSMVVLTLSFWLNPFLATEKNKILEKHMASENILDTLIPGRFQVSADDKRVVYVESIARERKIGNNLFIAEQKNPEENNWSVLSANKGFQIRDRRTRDRFVVALDGFRYEGIPGQKGYKIIQFEKYAVRTADEMMSVAHQPQEIMPTKKLFAEYYKNPKSAGELQWRISMPLATLLLALLAIPLSHCQPRQGRFANVFPAILIYVIYLNLLFVARDWVEIKSLTSGMWWVHGGMLVMILIMYLQGYPQRLYAKFYKSKTKKVEMTL